MNYRRVTDPAEIRAYLEGKREVAFDFETAPLAPWRADSRAALDSHRADIVGVSLSVEERTAIYIPLAHRDGQNADPLRVIPLLRDLVWENPEVVRIVHNLCFESAFLYAHGIILREPVYDTLCASQMTTKGPWDFRDLKDSGLKTLAAELCGEPLPTFSQVTGGRFFDELDSADPETIRYACADSDFALRLYHLFNEWFDRSLPAHRKLVEEIESPVAVYLGLMKHNGLPVDLPLMMRKKEEAAETIQRLKAEIEKRTGVKEIGKNFENAGCRNYLYDMQKLPVLVETETGKPSMDDKAMQLLREYCDEHHPDLASLFPLIREYRTWVKHTNTYIDGFLEFVNPTTGRIHPDLFALQTETGRMNCKNPNCQNMPRKDNDPIGVRSFIRAPEGWRILSLDYSQIELRVGAFYCRDRTMMETYRQGGDIHAATTSVLFRVPLEEAMDRNNPRYKERRTIAKNVNFGTFYGLFAPGLRNTLKFKAGISLSLDACQRILDNLKNGYPRLTRWQEETKRMAARRGYTETWLGRRRYLPKIRSRVWKDKSFAERCSLNTPIQGTAADILKIAITRILRGLPDRPWLRPILQIHDELTFLVPEEKVREATAFIRECMEEQPFPEFDLPLQAEASCGQDFADMREVEEVTQ